MPRPLLVAFLLATALSPLAAQADEACGRINTFSVMPRSEKLFPSVLLQIDGHNAGTTGQQDFRLPPGHHRLLVGERIDPREFDSLANQRRGRLDPVELVLDVDVRDQTTYQLAAKLLDASVAAIAGRRYWQPVVWKTLSESCH